MNKKAELGGLFAVLMLFVLAPAALAQSDIVTSSADSTSSLNSPKNVKVGLFIINLGKFDVSTGTFTADFYLSMICDQPCDPSSFEFMNGRATSTDKIIDTPTEKFYRIQASLSSPVDLRRFPFDKQEMQIVIEDKRNTINEIVYIPVEEESGIDDSIVMTGWKLDGWNSEVKNHEYIVYDETFSQYTFSIDITKIWFNSFMKTLLPVIFIMMVAVLTFLIDPDKITTRLTMTGTNLVAAVMFHVSISNQIPPVGYLTFADKFMILAYLILVISFVVNITLLELQERNNKKLVEKIHHSTEYAVIIAVPILFILMFIFLL